MDSPSGSGTGTGAAEEHGPIPPTSSTAVSDDLGKFQAPRVDERDGGDGEDGGDGKDGGDGSGGPTKSTMAKKGGAGGSETENAEINGSQGQDCVLVRLAALQSAVLFAVDLAAESINGHVLRLNPHLWRKEDMRSVYRDRGNGSQLPWSSEWPVVKQFEVLHPGLGADDVCVVYHGTRNTNRVKHILLEGYDARFNKPGSYGTLSRDGAYFGVSASVAQSYGEVILFIVPKAACGTVRGDGAFLAPACSTLPVGTYQRPSNWGFGDLFLRGGS